MPAGHAFLQNLALVLCVAAVTTVLFQRLRQPVVFGYLLAGMIVGPHIPVPLVADVAMVRTLSELGVILLMFSLGLEFSLRRVVQVATTSGLAALAETSVMLGVGYLVGQALGWSEIESVFTGAILAISSTTIIAKAFAEQGVHGRVTEVVFGILIVEDLIAILLVAVLTAVAAGGALTTVQLGITSVRLALFLLGLVGVGMLVVPRLVRTIAKTGQTETLLVAGVGICFAAALVALNFGYSVALGAFIAGSLVAESGEGTRVELLVRPVRDLFVAIFFVAVGMLIDPRVVGDHWLAILVLTAVVVIGKVFAVTVAAFLSGNGLRHSVQAGMSLAQIGEFSFIIAAVGTATGAVRPFLYPVAIAVSALTTLITPWLIRAAGPTAVYVDRKLPAPLQTFVALYGSWIERLRGTPRSQGGGARIRKLGRLVALDVALLLLVIVGAALETRRATTLLAESTGLSMRYARLGVSVAVAAVLVPLVVGLVRTTWRLAFALAVRALPAAQIGRVDFARAPRLSLVTTLHLAMLLAVGAPVLAITQPFLHGLPSFAVLAAVGVLLTAILWRSARNLQGHAQAGAQVIVAALAQQVKRGESDDELARAMDQMKALLPGLGEPAPLVVSAQSPAVGRTLKELNLRGLTGATVLCIARLGSDEEARIPTGMERLRAGDVLALAGSHDAVAAARALVADPATAAAEWSATGES